MCWGGGCLASSSPFMLLPVLARSPVLRCLWLRLACNKRIANRQKGSWYDRGDGTFDSFRVAGIKAGVQLCSGPLPWPAGGGVVCGLWRGREPCCCCRRWWASREDLMCTLVICWRRQRGPNTNTRVCTFSLIELWWFDEARKYCREGVDALIGTPRPRRRVNS